MLLILLLLLVKLKLELLVLLKLLESQQYAFESFLCEFHAQNQLNPSPSFSAYPFLLLIHETNPTVTAGSDHYFTSGV